MSSFYLYLMNDILTFDKYKSNLGVENDEVYVFKLFMQDILSSGDYTTTSERYSLTYSNDLIPYRGKYGGNLKVYTIKDKHSLFDNACVVIYVYNAPLTEVPSQVIENVRRIYSKYNYFIYLTSSMKSNTNRVHNRIHYVNSASQCNYKYIIKNTYDFSKNDIDVFKDIEGGCCRV